VDALYAKVESEFGTVDVLVNNAGVGKSALPIKDVQPEDFMYDFVSRPISDLRWRCEGSFKAKLTSK